MIRVGHVRHAGLVAPRAAELAEFYQQVWGLRSVAERGAALCLRGSGPEPFLLGLYPGERRRLHHLALSLPNRAAVDAAARELEAAGVPVLDPPRLLDEPGGGYGFSLVDPDGRRLELACDVALSEPLDWEAPVRPTKISHVVLNTPDLDRGADFYTRVLGFRVSDWSEHLMVFLRCNSDHHSLALSQAPHASLNHIAYEVPGIDEVMRGIGNLKRHGRAILWGPGRHGPGNNVFAYFQDPAGFVMEYTCDLLQIEDEASYQPQVWPRVPELIERWGTAGPPSPEARAAMLGEAEVGLLGDTMAAETERTGSLAELIDRRIARLEDRKLDWEALAFQARVEPRFRRAQMRYVGGGGTGKHDDPNVIQAEHFTFSTMLLPPGSEGPLHTHHDVEEVFFVLKGQVTCFFELDGERVERTLGPRDLAWIPAGVSRGERNDTDEVALMIVVLGTGRPQLPTYPEGSPLHGVKRER
ncbi:MAG: VOC family protein [Chloroflexi bacterium]|nr:VOC family protein [Chloroflexota bacterium]